MTRLLACLLASLFSLTLAQSAFSSGFALKEQSASALGNAFAGATSAAEDVTYMFFNPAALGKIEGGQLAAVGSYIVPQSDFRGGSASTILGDPIIGRQNKRDAAEDAFLPAMYAAWALSDAWRIGLGINTPFGLETHYKQDWIGRYHAVHSSLLTVNINPAVAWKINDLVTVAVGFQAQYADAELTNAVDFGTIATLQGTSIPGGNPATDGFADLEGDDWGYGYNLGLMLEPRPGTRLGLAYRSKIDHTIDGDVDFTLDPTGVGAGINAATGLFADSDAQADLTTPETASLGVYHEVTPQWAIMADVTWTRWSRFEELRVKFDNPVQPDNITIEDWDDTWFYALGLSWKPSPQCAFKIGVAYDESPVPESTRTPRIPDEDRTWLALGGHWQVSPAWGLDAGYTHIWVDDSSLNLVATPTNDTVRGNLSGDYDNAIDIVTLGATFSF